MSRLSAAKLDSLIVDKPESVAIFLYGDEEFLREQTLQRLVHAFLDPGTRDFNFDQLRGGDVTPENLASVIATPPMMAEYRVVLLRDAQSLAPKGRDVLLEVAKSPPSGTVLLIDATIPSGSRAKFYEELKKDAASMEFNQLDALEVPGWLIDKAEERGVRMEPDAARALASAIGSQLGVLNTELEKATAYVGDRGVITLEDIQAVGGYIPRVDRWEWFDKVGAKRFTEAMSEIPLLLDTGENGVGLIIGLAGHLLKIGLYAAGGSEGLERALRPNQRWLIRRIEPQARRWSLEEVDDALRSFLRADHLLKSASLSDQQVLEELILRLIENSDSSAEPAPRRSVAV